VRFRDLRLRLYGVEFKVSPPSAGTRTLLDYPFLTNKPGQDRRDMVMNTHTDGGRADGRTGVCEKSPSDRTARKRSLLGVNRINNSHNVGAIRLMTVADPPPPQSPCCAPRSILVEYFV